MDSQNQKQSQAPTEVISQPTDDRAIEVAESEQAESGSIHWQASEFVMHHKPSWWYVAFILVAVGISAIFFLLLRDIIAAVAILTVFGLAYTMAVRKPRTLSYVIDESGVTIGEQTHPFDSFRSFSLVVDGGMESVFLHPLQRFALPIIIYFAPEDRDTITEALSFHLPHEEREMSKVDKLSRTLRF